MIKLTGYGHGRANNWGGGDGTGYAWGNFGSVDAHLGGDGTGYGYGFFYGEGDGHLRMQSDSVHVTVLIINWDPITTAYQAHTMQSTGD